MNPPAATLGENAENAENTAEDRAASEVRGFAVSRRVFAADATGAEIETDLAARALPRAPRSGSATVDTGPAGGSGRTVALLVLLGGTPWVVFMARRAARERRFA